MKTLGIVAEYNPFHNGHKYMIDALKDKTGADYAVVIMSGDFTQRGCPSVCDKFARTKMALLSGADLVLELPIYYSTGSAEFFAKGAISTLNGLGVVDFLGFGSESDNISAIKEIADVLVNEPPVFSKALKENLKKGENYAAARAGALSAAVDIENCEDIISSSNDILGIEYVKALTKLDSAIEPISIKRCGETYHSKTLPEGELSFSSAEGIRELVENVKTDDPELLFELKKYMPSQCADIFLSCPHVHVDDFSNMLLYKLLLEKDFGYSKYADVGSDLSDKIRNSLSNFSSITDFTAKLKSKDIAYTRISRALLHILLNITSENLTDYTGDSTSYARILGFKKSASPFLKGIKSNTSIPVISKLADAEKALSPKEYRLLSETITASSIYDTVISNSRISEFSKQIITLP